MGNENNKLDNILAQNGLSGDAGFWGNLWSRIRGSPDIGLNPVVPTDSKKEEGFIDKPVIEESKSLIETENIPYVNLLTELERNKSKAYIITSGGKPHEKSGVTIGIGIDLGQHNMASLKKFGVNTNLQKKFKPLLGLKGENAKEALNKLYPKGLYVKGRDLTELNYQFINGKFKEFEIDYPQYNDLNFIDKGVMFSLHYQGALKGLETFKNTYKSTMDITKSADAGVYNNSYIKNTQPEYHNVLSNRFDNLFASKWWKSRSMQQPITPPLPKPEIIKTPTPKPIIKEDKEEDKGFLPKPKPDYGWEQVIT